MDGRTGELIERARKQRERTARLIEDARDAVAGAEKAVATVAASLRLARVLREKARTRRGGSGRGPAIRGGATGV